MLMALPLSYPLKSDNQSWRFLKKIAWSIFSANEIWEKLHIRAENLGHKSGARKEQCLALKGLVMLCQNYAISIYFILFFIKETNSLLKEKQQNTKTTESI